MQGTQLHDFVIDKLEDMKARDIKVIDVRGKSTVADFMVVCSGTSRTHVKSIAYNLAHEAKKAGNAPLGIEGADSSEWVLVDLIEIVVHVMQEETRDFYQLEKLWGYQMPSANNQVDGAMA